MFQFVSVVLLYNLYVSMFRNTRYGTWNFHLFMFQFVSKCFETAESVDLDIFSAFQFVSVVLLYNLYVSMFRNTRYGTWNFHLFMFQFVSKCFETIEYVSVVLLYIFMFRCFETPIWGLEFSPLYVSVCFECFETIKILNLDIFSLFQFVSVVLLYNQCVSMF